MESRPIGVTIITIIIFVAAIMSLIIGISVLIPGTPMDAIWSMRNPFPAGFLSSTIGIIFGYFLIILGLIILYAVYGLIKGHKLAWWITIIIFAANGIGDMLRIGSGELMAGLFGILIAVGFIYYLTRPNVREFFEKSKTEK